MKTVKQIRLHQQPPGWNQIAQLLVSSGASLLALFGGAIRDTELGLPVNDYDVRVWMDDGEARAFISQLLEVVDIEEVPSPGTNKIRYCFSYLGYWVDLSIRPVPVCYLGYAPIDAVAQERAGDSDVGLCSVALDPIGRAFATEEYELDKTCKTLTIYQNSENQERLLVYARKMQNKFQGHKIIWKE